MYFIHLLNDFEVPRSANWKVLFKIPLVPLGAHIIHPE